MKVYGASLPALILSFVLGVACSSPGPTAPSSLPPPEAPIPVIAPTMVITVTIENGAAVARVENQDGPLVLAVYRAEGSLFGWKSIKGHRTGVAVPPCGNAFSAIVLRGESPPESDMRLPREDILAGGFYNSTNCEGR